MSSTEGKGNDPVEPPARTSGASPGGKSSGKWIAVIIALIAVIGVLGGILVTHYSAPQAAGGPAAVLSSQVGAISQNGTYATNVTATGSFKNMTVYYGDGTSQVVNYSGSNTVTISHVYANPGEYYILADINYGSSHGYFLEPVKVNPEYPSVQYAYRGLTVNTLVSSPQLVNNISKIFKPGSSMKLDFLPNPGAGGNQIVSQSLTMMNQSGTVSQEQIPYVYNINSGAYQIPVQSVTYAGLQTGMYVLDVSTTSAAVNTTQTVSAQVTSTVVQNFTKSQSYFASSGTAISGISGDILQVGSINVTYGQNTTANYTTSTKMFLTTSSNITVNNGSVKAVDASGTTTISKGETAQINASTELTMAAFTNITFNRASSLVLNNTYTASMFYGSDSSLTLLNASVVNFNTDSVNVSITSVLSGTTTVPLNNGEYDASSQVTTQYYIDFPVVSSVSVQKSAATSLTNAEPNASGGYETMDPAIAYYFASSEILDNTLMTLDTYNGSSTNSFVPLVATMLPNLTNGGVNNNYVNKTVTTPWNTQYQYNVTPGENYTFYVNTNLKFANGDRMNATDVLYSFTRALLFDAGSPGTGGWVIGQYLLPGNIYTSNTFYNITTNITVNNSANSITFHFQQPMPAPLVYQIFDSSGTWIEDMKWYIQHGAGITWTPQGFENYKQYGEVSNYNSYVQNHVMADGPYKVSYIVPGSQLTLVANPDFVSPGPWYPKPTIDKVNILYSSSGQEAYLLLKSGQAQSANLPTTYWNQTEQMVQQGILQKHGFPTLSLYFYVFTEQVNTATLHTIYSGANMPSNFFVNPNVRKAFSYAFNYSLFYAQQIGNEIYNTTFFSPYVGMLPPGMLYNQTAQDLISSGTPVVNANGHEPFQIQQAKKYLNYYLNGTSSNTQHDVASDMNVQYNGNTVTYNGSKLVVPIFVIQGYPAYKAAAVTWASDLAQIMPGASFPVVELPIANIFAYEVPGQNPMPIEGGPGWFPDYPYPTDYLVPMAIPINNSFYMGGTGYTPYVVGNQSNSVFNLTEAAQMEQMISAMNNATSNATNGKLAEKWFHVVNGMSVNNTNIVYAGQNYAHWIMSSKLNSEYIVKYQENVMIGGALEILYNLMAYNTTA